MHFLFIAGQSAVSIRQLYEEVGDGLH